jgi:hypothetical protein
MRKLSFLLLTPLAACTSLAPPVGIAPAEACAPASLARYTGLPATDVTAGRMKRETGKTALRWVRPGMVVTMDYREDRLTVYVDAANKVERASCS